MTVAIPFIAAPIAVMLIWIGVCIKSHFTDHTHRRHNWRRIFPPFYAVRHEGQEGDEDSRATEKNFWFATVWQQVILNGLTFVGAGAAIAAFVVLFLQLKSAHEETRISQRAYVDIGRAGPGPIAEWGTDDAGNKTLNLWLTNGGNTPARRVYVNGASKPEDFLHLTKKPTLPKIVGRGFEVKPGEEVGIDVVNGLWSWVPGETIPAHSARLVPVSGANIPAFMKTGTMRINGSFEYMDIFGKYCCEPFSLEWSRVSDKFSYVEPGVAPREAVCAPDLINMCKPQGEPTMP
jgi:hypothetical protein